MVREMTGLEGEPVHEFVTFIQEGTPTGTMCAHEFRTLATGGSWIDHGPERLVRAYPINALPAGIPIRIANQRVLDAYLRDRSHRPPPVL
jgi:hypothetical protein